MIRRMRRRRSIRRGSLFWRRSCCVRLRRLSNDLRIALGMAFFFGLEGIMAFLRYLCFGDFEGLGIGLVDDLMGTSQADIAW